MDVKINFEDGKSAEAAGNCLVISVDPGKLTGTLHAQGMRDYMSLYLALVMLGFYLEDKTELLDVAIEAWQQKRDELAADALAIEMGGMTDE